MKPLIAILLCALVVVVWVSAADEKPQPGKDGWISMFDGKTLDGWKANQNLSLQRAGLRPSIFHFSRPVSVVAEQASNKTLGGGIRRHYFEKIL